MIIKYSGKIEFPDRYIDYIIEDKLRTEFPTEAEIKHEVKRTIIDSYSYYDYPLHILLLYSDAIVKEITRRLAKSHKTNMRETNRKMQSMKNYLEERKSKLCSYKTKLETAEMEKNSDEINRAKYSIEYLEGDIAILEDTLKFWGKILR